MTIEGIGCSDYTPMKQSQFTHILRVHLGVCAAIHRRKSLTYTYIDLNAGVGRYTYKGEEIIGSPLIAANELSSSPMPCNAHYCEIDRGSASILQSRLDEINGVGKVVPGNHHLTVPRIIRTLPRSNYGLIYSDENGKQMPVDLLRQCAQRLPLVDILIYTSATNCKRLYGAGVSNTRLLDHIKSIPKQHVIVREPVGPHQWTFLILTNWDAFPAFKSRGFYSIDSSEGERILHKLNYDREEQAALEAGNEHCNGLRPEGTGNRGTLRLPFSS